MISQQMFLENRNYIATKVFSEKGYKYQVMKMN